MPDRKVELRGPADEAFVRLVRGATLSVANQIGFTVDTCDELRVAADEACNVLIANGADELVVALDHGPALLTLTFLPSRSDGAGDGDGDSGRGVDVVLDSVAELVLATMVDEVTVEGGTIVLHKTIPLIDPSHA